MANPKLPLKRDDRVVAFDTVVDRLRSDPALKRVVKTWRTWSDDPLDAAPPTLQQCPWVRLTPYPDRSDWSNDNSSVEFGAVHVMPLLITIETAVAGSRWEDSVNLWGAIQDALYPQIQGSRVEWEEAFHAVGISKITVMKPAFGIPDPMAAPLPEMIVSDKGTLSLLMHFAT